MRRIFNTETVSKIYATLAVLQSFHLGRRFNLGNLPLY